MKNCFYFYMLKLARFYAKYKLFQTNRKQIIKNELHFYFYKAEQKRARDVNLRNNFIVCQEYDFC